jgi:peptidoglycan-associated lipoprotein
MENIKMKKLLSLFCAVIALSACSTLSESSLFGGSECESKMARDFMSNAEDRVFFAFDSSAISSDAAEALDSQAKWLNKHEQVNVVVQGYCDERGTREYNLALGERRANAVKQYLVSKGIAADRISTISYGKERPAVLGSNEAAWAQNRRAVTVVTSAE